MLPQAIEGAVLAKNTPQMWEKGEIFVTMICVPNREECVETRGLLSILGRKRAVWGQKRTVF